MYGKIENGKLIPAPKSVVMKNMEVTVTDEDGKEYTVIEDRRVINPKEEVLASLGYLPIEETEAPVTEEGYRADPSYEKKDGKIVRQWTVEKKTKEPPSTEERLLTLEKALGRIEALLSGKENVKK